MFGQNRTDLSPILPFGFSYMPFIGQKPPKISIFSKNLIENSKMAFLRSENEFDMLTF